MKLENQSMDNVVTRSIRTTYDMIELILAWRLQIVLSDLHLNFLKQRVLVEDGDICMILIVEPNLRRIDTPP